jgi:hypothetical protein
MPAPAPISLDLRRRIVQAVEGGSSIRAAARRFAVSPSAAIKLMQRVRATGSAAPERYGGHRVLSSRCMRLTCAGWSRRRPDIRWRTGHRLRLRLEHAARRLGAVAGCCTKGTRTATVAAASIETSPCTAR